MPHLNSKNYSTTQALICLLICFSFNLILNAKNTYKLKFGEDLRTVALKYNCSENILTDLNPTIVSRYVFSEYPHKDIINAVGSKITLPEKATLQKSYDKDLELSIFLENMRLLYSNPTIGKSAIENEQDRKIYYYPFVERMKKDFGMEIYNPILGETLTVIGLRYKDALSSIEDLNPALQQYMAKEFKTIGRHLYNENIRQLEILSTIPVILPKNLSTSESYNDDYYTSYKLWALNLSVGLANNKKTWREIYLKKHGGAYVKTCLIARYEYSKAEALYRNNWNGFKFELERIAEAENDGTLATMETNYAEVLEYYYDVALRECRIQEEEARRKKEKRKKFWTNLGRAALQSIAISANTFYGGNAYSVYNYMPLNFNSPQYFLNISPNNFTLDNLNAGFNAALISANSSYRLNQSWSQFQSSMCEMRPYTFEDLERMSVSSFNSQFGFDFSQDQYNQVLDNWSHQGASDNAIGGVSLPSKPVSSNHNDWETYYRTAYNRWEHHAESTYNSLTNQGIKYTDLSGRPNGNIGDRGNFGNSSVQLKLNLYDIQKQMRQIRHEAAKQGIDITQSQWEVATVSL